MSYTKIPFRIVPEGLYGNSDSRMVFTGYRWDKWDLEFCIHGEKLRWDCGACNEKIKSLPRKVRLEAMEK